MAFQTLPKKESGFWGGGHWVGEGGQSAQIAALEPVSPGLARAFRGVCSAGNLRDLWPRKQHTLAWQAGYSWATGGNSGGKTPSRIFRQLKGISSARQSLSELPWGQKLLN